MTEAQVLVTTSRCDHRTVVGAAQGIGLWGSRLRTRRARVRVLTWSGSSEIGDCVHSALVHEDHVTKRGQARRVQVPSKQAKMKEQQSPPNVSEGEGPAALSAGSCGGRGLCGWVTSELGGGCGPGSCLLSPHPGAHNSP